MRQKSYDEINYQHILDTIEPLVRALIPFAEMDRPGEIKSEGVGSDAQLAEIVLGRGSSLDSTILTGQDFRNAARVLFELTGAVPESYWSYEIEFK